MSGVSVLVVDDEELLREILREELESMGATVTEADGGKLALKKLQAGKIDILITDVRMPAGDGIVLLKESRTVPYPPLVFLCTGFSDTTVEAARALGASDIFSKPCRSSTMIASIVKAWEEFKCKDKA